MSKMGSKKSFVKFVKEKYKRLTHDKTWDSDEETDTSVHSGNDEQGNAFHDDIEDSSTTTVTTKSSPSEISETPSLTHSEDPFVSFPNNNFLDRDNLLKDNVGARPKIQMQLDDTTEDYTNVHKYNSSRVITRDFETVTEPKRQTLKRIPEYEQNINVLNNEDFSGENKIFENDTDDEPTSDYESEYPTIRRNRISDDHVKHRFAASRNFCSVPDLHSKELLEAEQNNNKPGVLNIIHVSHSREVIVSPNDGTASFKKTTNKTFSENEAKFLQLEDRKTKMLTMFDQTQPKVETELFIMGLTYIQRKTHFPLVILKGSRGGCGFAAKMLFKRIILTQSKVDSYFMKEAEELSILNERENAVVLVIEANGGTGGNEKRLDDWFEILKEKMPIGSKEHGNLTLILTLNDSSRIKHPILKKYSEYVLDADRYPPSNEIKGKLVEALMKQNNIRAVSITNKPLQPLTHKEGKIHFIDKHIVNGIVPFLASKGCIGELSEFFTGHLSEGLNFFRKPIPKCVVVMRKLCKEGSKSFLALLAVHALGSVPTSSKYTSPSQQKLDDSFEKPWRSMTAIDKLSKAKTLGKQYDGIDVQFLYRFAKENGHQCNLGNTLRKAAYGLVGKFLDKTGEVFKFSNGRIYYSFLLVLYEAYPKALENCDDEFFFNFIKLRNSVYNEEPDTCILIDDRKLNEMTRWVCCRFKREIMLKNVAKCMRHPAMSPKFFKLFLKYVNETPHLTWKVLKQTDADPKEAYSCLYHGMTNHDLDLESSKKNITELILSQSIWKRKQRSVKWKEWTALQKRETLVLASEVSNVQTFRFLVDAGAEISLQALKKAINNGSEEIIKIIVEHWPSTKSGWAIDAAKYAAMKISEANLTPDLVRLLKNLITNSRNKSLAIIGKPPLIHWIIKKNKTVVLRKLLEDKCLKAAIDIDTIFNDETPLCTAIRLGHSNLVQLLLEHNALIGREEFAMASSKGDVCVLELLYKKRPATIVEENENGFTPLYYAVTEGRLEAVKFILSKSKNRRQSHQVSSMQTSNVCLSQKQFENMCKIEPDLQTKNIEGQTAMHVAAMKGHTKIIEILVHEGFDICATDRSGDTPMSLAYRNKEMNALRCILNIWNVKSLPVDENLIMLVVRNHDTDGLDLMNEYGFQINNESLRYGVILKESIENGLHDMVRCILSNWGYSNKAIDGLRPIHLAAKNGDLGMLKILIEFHADMTERTDRLWDSIIHIGVQQNNLVFVKSVFQLPDSNDLIDMKNFLGDTALHVASKFGYSLLLKTLLELGFKTEIPNKDGLRPLAIVEKSIQAAITCKNKRKWKSLIECKKLLESQPRRQF